MAVITAKVTATDMTTVPTVLGLFPSLLVESFVAVAVELGWTDGGGVGVDGGGVGVDGVGVGVDGGGGGGGGSEDNEKNEYIS